MCVVNKNDTTKKIETKMEKNYFLNVVNANKITTRKSFQINRKEKLLMD